MQYISISLYRKMISCAFSAYAKKTAATGIWEQTVPQSV